MHTKSPFDKDADLPGDTEGRLISDDQRFQSIAIEVMCLHPECRKATFLYIGS